MLKVKRDDPKNAARSENQGEISSSWVLQFLRVAGPRLVRIRPAEGPVVLFTDGACEGERAS